MANRYEYKICHLLPTLPTQLLGLLICNTVNNFIFPIQKCIQLVGDNGGSSIVTNVIRSWGMLITEEAVHVWGQRSTWEISIPSTQFCCEPKTVLIVFKNVFNIIYRL